MRQGLEAESNIRGLEALGGCSFRHRLSSAGTTLIGEHGPTWGSDRCVAPGVGVGKVVSADGVCARAGAVLASGGGAGEATTESRWGALPAWLG